MKENGSGPAAWHLEGERLVKGSVQAAFPFLAGRGHVVSLVGGGGKTTLMYAMADIAQGYGLHTAAMTSTRIARPGAYCRTMEECCACWAAGSYAVCGEPLEDKLTVPAPEVVTQLFREADMLLIEADGARRLPCKAPAAHEPVILPQTDIVIAVMGLDALGQKVEACCLRVEQVRALLGCDGAHRLTGEDMVKLLLSEHGSRKGVGSRDFYVVLNKCDDAQRLAEGRDILERLRARGQTHAVLTRLDTGLQAEI